MILVADASTLIALATCNSQDLLEALFGDVLVSSQLINLMQDNQAKCG